MSFKEWATAQRAAATHKAETKPAPEAQATTPAASAAAQDSGKPQPPKA